MGSKLSRPPSIDSKAIQDVDRLGSSNGTHLPVQRKRSNSGTTHSHSITGVHTGTHTGTHTPLAYRQGSIGGPPHSTPNRHSPPQHTTGTLDGSSSTIGYLGHNTQHTGPSTGAPVVGLPANRLPVLGGVRRAATIVHKDITKRYIFEPKALGTGFSGPVHIATHRVTGRRYAVKSFVKTGAPREKINLLRNEAKVYLRLDHPNIARLIEIYDDEKNVYLVIELCVGGELYDRLSARKLYNENDARKLTIEMLSAIRYLHTHGVVHRDLKLENWLFESEEEDSSLKLIDFGFSKFWNSSFRRMQATCGTLAYVSPDTLQGEYTNACDMWSIGVIVYMLLVGYPPFYGNEDKIFDSILTGSYSTKGARWNNVSSEAKSFVHALLEKNPDKRLTTDDVFVHPWLRRHASPTVNIDPKVLQDMQRFGKQQKLKRAALVMMAYSLTSDEIKGVHNTFKAIDTHREGTIRFDELSTVMQQHLSSVSADEIQETFQSMDSTGDKEIYYNDFLAVVLMTRLDMHQHLVMYEHLIREAFRKFDTDNTDHISLANLVSVFGGMYKEEALRQMLNEGDRNGDGEIDYEEFLNMVKNDGQDS